MVVSAFGYDNGPAGGRVRPWYIPWWPGWVGPFDWSGRAGHSLWRGGQGVDFVPGQDEIGLVRVGVVEADQPFAGSAHEAGGGVEQRPAQDGGAGSAQLLVVVEGQQPQPGEQGAGDGHGGAPGLVERQGVAGQPTQPEVFAVLDRGLDHRVVAVEGVQLRIPISRQVAGHDLETLLALALDRAGLFTVTGVQRFGAGHQPHPVGPSLGNGKQAGDLGDVGAWADLPAGVNAGAQVWTGTAMIASRTGSVTSNPTL